MAWSLTKTVTPEGVDSRKPKIWRYLLGALGFIFSIFTVISTFEFGWILLILIWTGGFVGIMVLNDDVGYLISYYTQKLMRKIFFDEKYDVLFVVLINILYQLICSIISVGFLMLKDGKNGKIVSCMDSCSTIDMSFVFFVSFAIIAVLNITTLVASINKLDSRQKKKKVRNKK